MIWSKILSIILCLLLRPAFARRRLPNEVSDTPTTKLGNLSSRDLNDDESHRRVRVPSSASPDDHLVTDLPLLDNSRFPVTHWAGLLPASDDGHNYLFYWLFAPEKDGQPVDLFDPSIPLVIWLNGGPACSSMDGLWLENGPFRLFHDPADNDNWSIEIDDFSWHKAPAFVLYIDQPVGTGISFSTNKKYPKNDVEVNTDFYYFLKEFLKLHSDKFLDGTNTLIRELFFSGESHAGHYIPSMMNFIRKQNDSADLKIPLSGAAIGNGWIDPRVQYSAHEAAYGKGIIGLAQKRALAKLELKCQADLKAEIYVSSPCFELLRTVVSESFGNGSPYKVSQYDARKVEKVGVSRNFPEGHKDVEAYLGGSGKQSIAKDYKQVLAAIHSMPSHHAGQEYEECTDPPYNALKHQDGLGVTQDVVDLLNNGVRMLFFNGIEDLICNHVGNEIAVENFEWRKQKDYQLSKRFGWKSPTTGELAGYMKEFENLSYLKVKGSGHMVPMDVPAVSLDMIRAFVQNQSFEDYEQQIQRSSPNCPVCPSYSSSDEDEEGKCPECPSCPSNAKITSNNDNWEETLSEESPVVLVGVAVGTTWLVSLCLFWYCSRKRRQKKSGRAGEQYDMEMTPASRYTDDDDEGHVLS